MVGALAFVFPGQASQKSGMAADLLAQEPAARDLFNRATAVMGWDVAEMCTTADDAALQRTEVAQPSLLTISVAWLEVMTARGLRPAFVAGHSLGEFAAWVAAGALPFEEALALVKRRGELMEWAGTQRPGGMAAVIGLSDEQVATVCEAAREAGEVVVANYNSPGQVVVSGEPTALARVAELAKAEKGRAIPLRVSGAFHSPLMQPAAEEFAGLVAGLSVHPPVIPVVANATAEVVATAEGVREAMARQMTSPVFWTRSVQTMVAGGVGTVVEVGPGTVLTKLVERICPGVRARAVGAPAALGSLVEEIGT